MPYCASLTNWVFRVRRLVSASTPATLWAAGYDVADEEGWLAMLDEVSQACGLDRLRWMHATDCKFGRGSNKDRHEWIGQGCIGADGFRAMACLPSPPPANVVVEMPGEMPEKDAVNVALLKSWRDGAE